MKSWLRPAVRWAARGNTFEHFVGALESWSPRDNRLLRVLTYHRVDEPSAQPHLATCALSATPPSFARQMQFLAENYDVISLRDLLSATRTQSRLPERSVLITFDDGYRDFAEHAWPILRRLGLPATLFVPTAYPGNSGRAFWWDRLYQAVRQAAPGSYHVSIVGRLVLNGPARRVTIYNQLAKRVSSLPGEVAQQAVDAVCHTLDCRWTPSHVLGWNELRKLAANPLLTLACHTRNHVMMNRAPLDQVREEVLGSLEDLRREVGHAPPALAYPGGAYTEEVVRMLRSEGFELAFTTKRGLNDLRTADPLRLRRINVGHRCPFSLWRAQLCACPRLAR